LGPGYRVIAVDTRGHGRSEKTGPINDWTVPARDIAELLEHLNLKDAIGAGHSMGGHLLVQVAATHPRAFKRLVLIDPVMLPPRRMNLHLPAEGRLSILSRRNTGPAADSRCLRRAILIAWRTVRDDVGLVPAASGQGFELACPPAIEASIYMGHAGRDIYALAARVQTPVTVLRARPRAPGPRDFTDFAASPTWEGVARTFTKGRDVPLPHLTHFIPMQEPELTARFIADGNASA
jgi:pimeloyl-ACP methyl ester carboxylesterase